MSRNAPRFDERVANEQSVALRPFKHRVECGQKCVLVLEAAAG